jgi:hypothetical protein
VAYIESRGGEAPRLGALEQKIIRAKVGLLELAKHALKRFTHAAHDLARPKCTVVPSSADADVGLHQRIDPLG